MFMRSIGYLGNRRRAYFLLSLPVLICFGAIYGTYKMWSDFDKVIINLFKTSGLLTVTLRSFVIIQKEKKLYDFFDYISQLYRELQVRRDFPEKKFTVKKMKIISHAILGRR